jgi:hypothetical protein
LSSKFPIAQAAAVCARIDAEAPGLRLCFVQKPDKGSASLRDGIVDLESGAPGAGQGDD